MPTYEYECATCGQGFELFQSMKDDSLKTCPEAKCRQETWGHGEVKRKLGVGAGFIFKGSGFYITDYRSEGYKTGAKNDKAPAATPSVSTAAPAAAPSGGSQNTSKPAAAPAKTD